MNVLIACEESQTVCIAFRHYGVNAFSCDIQDCSGGFPEYHIKSDVLPLLNGHCSFYTCNGDFYTLPDEWDLIIAFPPCTYITKAAATLLFPHGELNEDRYEKGLQAVEFFYYIYNCNCKRICIENPTPCKIFNLPLPSQIIQPFYFGHKVQKRTQLWLKGLPPLFYTDIVIPEYTVMTYFKSNGKARSKFWSGVANAMASQWLPFLESEMINE